MKDDGKGVGQKTAEAMADSITQILQLASEAAEVQTDVSNLQSDEKPNKKEKKKENWTIMVFMSADDSLLPFAEIDIQEMQKVGSLEPHDNLNIFIQLHRKAGDPVLRYKIGDKPKLLDNVVGVGDGAALSGFLGWATGARPKDHYMLVLWGHAYRFGFGRFDDDLLMLDELEAALGTKFTDKKLEILGCDACAMSKVDIAQALTDRVEVLVASQTVIPFSGWPYQKVLKEFRDNSTLSSLELAKRTLKHYRDSYEPPSVTLTALDLTQQTAFTQALDLLGHVLSVETATSVDRRAEVRLAFREAARDDGEQLFDLQDLCDQIRQKTDSQNVKQAAEQVIAELAVGKAFVAGHERRGPETRRLNGVGIFQFPPPDKVTQIIREGVERKKRDGVPAPRGLERWEGWRQTIENVGLSAALPVSDIVGAKQRT